MVTGWESTTDENRRNAAQQTHEFGPRWPDWYTCTDEKFMQYLQKWEDGTEKRPTIDELEELPGHDDNHHTE